MKMLDKEYLTKINQPKIQKEISDVIRRTSVQLFFFASDETVKKFVEWYKSAQDVGSSKHQATIYLMAQLIVLMRKDLGYRDTSCNEDDLLYLLINDWDEAKSRELRQLVDESIRS